MIYCKEYFMGLSIGVGIGMGFAFVFMVFAVFAGEPEVKRCRKL